MLALRLTRCAHAAVQLRRLLVAAASAGTGFLLLSALGYAMSHPDAPTDSMLRLAWCAPPLAATVYFAVAVARTDPGTKPRPGLSAIGLGPAHLMAISATTTALSCTFGSLLALLVFLHLRGDLTGMPFDGAAAAFLAADQPLPLPAALTLLTLPPMTASLTVALSLRPRDPSPTTPRPTPRGYGRFGAYGRTAAARETFGTYGRFGARLREVGDMVTPGRGRTSDAGHADGRQGAEGLAGAEGRESGNGRWGAARRAGRLGRRAADGAAEAYDDQPPRQPTDDSATDTPPTPPTQPAGSRAARAARVGAGGTPSGGGTPQAPGCATHPPATANGTPRTPGSAADPSTAANGTPEAPDSAADPTTAPDASPEPHDLTPTLPPAPGEPPAGLPWGIATLAAGLAVEAYASRTGTGTKLTLPTHLPTGPTGVLAGWLLTTLGLSLAAPGLTHLCGRLLQAVRPGALRLLAGRVLMQEATRIGRPLGVVCAVMSAAYAILVLSDPATPAFGPLTTLGATLVTGCTVATLLTAAVEAKHARADTTAALVRLGAPTTVLRSAAALRAGALLAFFGPLTLIVAELAAQPLAR